MSEPEIVNNPLSEATGQRLEEVRRGLLRLHKVLLDAERTAYEQVYGRVSSGGEMLQLVLGHEWFAWLRSLSELIVRIDEAQEAEEPMTERDALAFLAQVRMLLQPDAEAEGFGRRYHQALQQSPDSILAHAEVVRLLPAESAGA